MENRNIFALHGLTGMIIATILLITVESTLVYLAINVQRDVAQDYYYIEDIKSVKMFSTENASHVKLLSEKDK